MYCGVDTETERYKNKTWIKCDTRQGLKKQVYFFLKKALIKPQSWTMYTLL